MTSSELAATLRAWRYRVSPADVGLPHDGPRRVPGLRREELAALAGISVDYLVRLEQGRATPSAQVVDSLGRALRLGDAERDHLYSLAGLRAPGRTLGSAALTPAVLRLLDRRADQPIAVYDLTWTLQTWTPVLAALLGDPSDLSARDRNVAWAHFTGAASTIEHTPDAAARFERAVVADLHLARARFPHEASVVTIVDELHVASGRFARLWASRPVAAHVSDTKTVHHRGVGPIRLDCDVFTVPDSDVRIVQFTPPDDDAAERLALVATLGTQKLA